MDHAFGLTKKYGRIALAWASAPLDLTALKNAHEQRRAFPISIRRVVAAHTSCCHRSFRAGAGGVCRLIGSAVTSEGTAFCGAKVEAIRSRTGCPYQLAFFLSFQQVTVPADCHYNPC